MTSSSIISKESVHRLLSDVRQIMREPLDSNGIYYTHDETDMLKGWAMIVGPSDTPYFGGFYFFKFQFPSDYPYSPPVVTCHTGDGFVRFNPNLYTNGKVCISILNTWRGEPWSACQTISTVLLTLCTILCQKYNELLEYANVKIAVCNIVDKSRSRSQATQATQATQTRATQMPEYIFSQQIETVFTQNYDAILAFLETRREIVAYPISIRLYGLRQLIDYPLLYNRMTQLKLKLK
jgi:ubiquitin-conjugating enzyme E2 Z